MSDDSGKTKKLSLSGSKLTLGSIDASKLRSGPAVATSRKTVQVEVRRKRAPAAPSRSQTPPMNESTGNVTETVKTSAKKEPTAPPSDDRLTAQERAARVRALQEGLKKPSLDFPVETEVKTEKNTSKQSETLVSEPLSKDSISPDTVSQRRAAELAEMEQIEAEEASRRAEDARKNSKNILHQKQDSNSEYGGTMRLGSYPAVLNKKSFSYKIYKTKKINERHRHRYEVNINYKEKLEQIGLNFSGISPDGLLPEIVEIKNHPWFIGVQFHPELKSRPFDPHPLFSSFIKASIKESKNKK